MLVHTGQHYDDALSRVFFDELALPRPEHRFDLGGGSNTEQTARMLSELAPLLASEAPDVVLVYGDTNSTLAGALAAAQAGVPVAHVEAGMRSYDRRMPEELNRVLTDHASSLLLCSTPAAAETLRAEQVVGEVVVVGDVMVDVFELLAPRADAAMLERLGVAPGEYLLATAHRAGNVDDPARLRALVDVLTGMPLPVVLPLHPRTRARLAAAGLLDALDGVIVAPPLGYLEFTALLLRRARRADRLRRRAEGGLPGRRAVHHAARHDRVARDGRRGLERARGPRRRRGARGAGARRCPPRGRRCTATGGPASASSRRSSGWRDDPRDRGDRPA